MERYSLTPATLGPRSARAVGPVSLHGHVCTFVTRASRRRRWIALESLLNDFAFGQKSQDARWGVSTLGRGGSRYSRPGAGSPEDRGRPLYQFWDLAKRELWGEPAIPAAKRFTGSRLCI